MHYGFLASSYGLSMRGKGEESTKTIFFSFSSFSFYFSAVNVNRDLVKHTDLKLHGPTKYTIYGRDRPDRWDGEALFAIDSTNTSNI